MFVPNVGFLYTCMIFAYFTRILYRIHDKVCLAQVQSPAIRHSPENYVETREGLAL